MSGETCEGCGRSVPVAGGIANVWSFSGNHTGGMTLELADGTEHFLCFECIDELEDDPTDADVERLPTRPREDAVDAGATAGRDPGNVGLGIVAGGAVGVALGVALGGEIEPWLATGAAVGVALALLAARLQSDE